MGNGKKSCSHFAGSSVCAEAARSSSRTYAIAATIVPPFITETRRAGGVPATDHCGRQAPYRDRASSPIASFTSGSGGGTRGKRRRSYVAALESPKGSASALSNA